MKLDERLKNLSLLLDEENEIITLEKTINLLREQKRKMIENQVSKLSEIYNIKKGDVVEIGYGKHIETIVVYSLFTKYDLYSLSGLEDKINKEDFRRYTLHAKYYKLTNKNKIDKRKEPIYNEILIEGGVKIGVYDFENDKIIENIL